MAPRTEHDRPGISNAASSGAARASALRLLAIYAALARRGEHLLGALLGAAPPRQWAHYPEDDAIDLASGFQWFYHSHSPQDRPATAEHGHIHLFARRPLWRRRLRSKRETAFAQLDGGPSERVETRHLLSIGLDAKGLPVGLFTVNSWVTGDLMLSARATGNLLDRMTLDTGNPNLDAVLESVVRLYSREISALLAARDATLFGFKGGKVLAQESLEVLSELAIDVDAKMAAERL